MSPPVRKRACRSMNVFPSPEAAVSKLPGHPPRWSAKAIAGRSKRTTGLPAFDGVSFRVDRGEVFGFLGPNGAGKSTTIKVLTTLLRPTSGGVRVDGHDVVREAAAGRRVIGYAAQKVGVDDDLTGRENLVLQCRLYHRPPGQIPDRVGGLLKTAALGEA